MCIRLALLVVALQTNSTREVKTYEPTIQTGGRPVGVGLRRLHRPRGIVALRILFSSSVGLILENKITRDIM